MKKDRQRYAKCTNSAAETQKYAAAHFTNVLWRTIERGNNDIELQMHETRQQRMAYMLKIYEVLLRNCSTLRDYTDSSSIVRRLPRELYKKYWGQYEIYDTSCTHHMRLREEPLISDKKQNTAEHKSIDRVCSEYSFPKRIIALYIVHNKFTWNLHSNVHFLGCSFFASQSRNNEQRKEKAA